jgi:hypothetical protein
MNLQYPFSPLLLFSFSALQQVVLQEALLLPPLLYSRFYLLFLVPSRVMMVLSVLLCL